MILDLIILTTVQIYQIKLGRVGGTVGQSKQSFTDPTLDLTQLHLIYLHCI